LIILTLLSELSTIPTSQHKSNARALDLLLTLHYVYWGTTMPPYVHGILEKTLDRVCDMVKNAVNQGEAVDLKWLYVEPKTVREMDRRLTWWKQEGKTAVSFDAILPSRSV
jgi:hypothetical protein